MQLVGGVLRELSRSCAGLSNRVGTDGVFLSKLRNDLPIPVFGLVDHIL